MPFLILGILKALVRDDFRCIVTRMYDSESTIWSTEIYQEVMNSDVATTVTACVHIFPESIAMMQGVDDKDTKVQFADRPSVAINRLPAFVARLWHLNLDYHGIFRFRRSFREA